MEMKLNPETGLYEANNQETWAVGYKPPAPEPVAEQPHIWGDIGQGVRGGPTLDMSRISDATYYREHKQEIEERLYYEAGIDYPKK